MPQIQLGKYIEGTENVLRLIWRVVAFLLLVATLVYFTPVIAYQSVLHLPLATEWAYVLILTATCGIFIVVEAFFDKENRIVGALLWVITLAWLAAFGIFAKIYIGRKAGKPHAYKGTNTAKMQIGTWVLLINTGFWLGYAIFFTLAILRKRKMDRRAMGLC